MSRWESNGCGNWWSLQPGSAWMGGLSHLPSAMNHRPFVSTDKGSPVTAEPNASEATGHFVRYKQTFISAGLSFV